MAIARVHVDNTIFQWILRQVDISQLSQKWATLFDKWISGKCLPTYKQLEGFSKASLIPFGYFFLQEAPSEDIGLLKFRTISSKTNNYISRSLIDKIYEMYDVQQWMIEYRKNNGFNNIKYLNKISKSWTYDKIAQQIRIDLGLSLNWFVNSKDMVDSFKIIRSKLEDIGIVTMVNGVVRNNTQKPLNINEFRAFAIYDKLVPLIFINNNDSKGGKLFSLFHEIVHIWLGLDDLFNMNEVDIFNYGINKEEVLCNKVASELLAPNSLFIHEWNNAINIDYKKKIKKVSRYFRCGPSTIAVKALENGFITQSEYYDFIEELIKLFNSRRKSKGGDYYNTMASRIDKCFITALSESLHVGSISYKDVYHLTDIRSESFNNLRKHMGIF